MTMVSLPFFSLTALFFLQTSILWICMAKASISRDPAQRRAREQGLVQTLMMSFRQTPGRLDFVTEYGPKCLELVLRLDSEPDSEIPGELTSILLSLATNSLTPWETFQSLLNCLSLLLEKDSTKSYLLSSMLVSDCLTLMLRLRYWEDTLSISESLVDDEDREDALKAIRDCRSSLVVAIADVFALESFLERYPLESDLVSLILHWLESEDLDLLACAALALGNVAHGSETCEALIAKYDVHLLLTRIIRDQSQVSALHAAGGALKNLAVGSPSLREQIVAAGALEHCQKFYLAKAVMQVQLMGLSLTRILVANSLSSVARLVDPTQSTSNSSLKSILDLYSGTTEQSIRIEVGRIIVSILREAARCSAGSQQKISLDRQIFDLCPGFIEPLLQMVIQDRWPVVASEGWFALALFTRSAEGATIFAGLSLPKEFYQALKQVAGKDLQDIHSDEPTAAEGESSPGRGLAHERNQKNKVNVYIFLSEFLKNADSLNNQHQRNLFQLLVDGEEVTDIDIDRALDFDTRLAFLRI
ncbi:hypothetical protein TWF696_005202 [Orbilia brochopaga]|uniref:Uncharacterized protein n=1 Tax=Orbilia brochopaga TaxID=3140254 RepID=A0AAV9V6L6_9PEZI